MRIRCSRWNSASKNLDAAAQNCFKDLWSVLSTFRNICEQCLHSFCVTCVRSSFLFKNCENFRLNAFVKHLRTVCLNCDNMVYCTQLQLSWNLLMGSELMLFVKRWIIVYASAFSNNTAMANIVLVFNGGTYTWFESSFHLFAACKVFSYLIWLRKI